jgi:uncharacterized membrane protein affecting hemolysin expression
LKFKGSIRKKLTAIILLVTTLTSLIGYGSFVYWYMQNQQKQSFNLAQTIGKVLAQDVANNFKKSYKIIDNNLQLYIKALYQNNHLGYMQLNFKVKSIWDVIKQNIKSTIQNGDYG